MSRKFTRKVSPTEKLYTALTLSQPPYAIQFVVQGKGQLTEDQLRTALEKTAAQNPGCTLKLKGFLKWLSWGEGALPPLTMLKSNEWTGRNSYGAPFLHNSFDPYNGPTCEIQYVETPDYHYLIFRAMHAVMDGIGTELWAEDFFRALRNEPLLGHPSTLTDWELVQQLKKVKGEKVKNNALHPCGPPDSRGAEPHGQWRRHTVNRPYDSSMLPSVAIALAQEARQNNPHAYNGDTTVRIAVPANMRPNAPDERSTGNLVGMITQEIDEEMTAEQVSLSIVHKMYKKIGMNLADIYDLAQWVPVKLLASMLKKQQSRPQFNPLYTFSSIMTTMGPYKKADLSCPDFEAHTSFYVPPCISQSCLAHFIGFEDKTEFTFALSPNFATNGRMERMFEKLVAVVDPEAAS